MMIRSLNPNVLMNPIFCPLCPPSQKQSTNRSSRFTHESKLYLPLRKHDYGQNCLSYRGATIWNGLKARIKNSKSCDSFKHSVKSCFFENLKNKEDNARIT